MGSEVVAEGEEEEGEVLQLLSPVVLLLEEGEE